MAQTQHDLDDLAGDALVADGLATTLAGGMGGSATTTYAENIGVMAATRVYSTAKTLSFLDRNALWTQPPNTSDQIPACLQLCFGMPVLIRNNDATELCITNGQEARVVGWTFDRIPGFPGKS